MASFPRVFKFQPSDIRDIALKPAELYYKILVGLEHIQNIFFLERLLIQRGWAGHADQFPLISPAAAGTRVRRKGRPWSLS